MNKSVKNILIYRLGSLGDTVMALPCFNKIRDQFPKADITLLTNKPISSKAAPIEAVLGQDFFFDRVLAYPVGTRNPLLLVSLIKRIRSLNVDTIINITSARSRKSVIRDKLFFRLAGVSNLIGFPADKEDFDLVVDPATGLLEREDKKLARRISILGDIDLKENRWYDLHLTPIEIQKAEQSLNTLPKNIPIIAISAGTKVQANDWELSNWISFINELKLRLPGWGLVIIGAQEEYDISNRFLAAWDSAGVNLCGKTSPRVSAAILKHAQVFVGHDSGPLHLAASVSTPCVGIYSARHLPGLWFPRGNRNKILYHKTDCAGCELMVCFEQHKKCILSISPDEVINAVIDVVKNLTLIKK